MVGTEMDDFVTNHFSFHFSFHVSFSFVNILFDTFVFHSAFHVFHLAWHWPCEHTTHNLHMGKLSHGYEGVFTKSDLQR